MFYEKYRKVAIDPKTGICEVFNKGHFKGNNLRYEKISPQDNSIFKKAHKDVMCLLAYGVGKADTQHIVGFKYPEYGSLNPATAADNMTKWCIYYSVRPKELAALLKGYEAVCETLIDAYEYRDNVTNNTLPSIDEIRTTVQKLVNYTKIEIPTMFVSKDLKLQETQLKMKMNNCSNREMFSRLYGELIENFELQDQYNRDKKNYKQYKAIRDLKSSGILDACQAWLANYPYIN